METRQSLSAEREWFVVEFSDTSVCAVPCTWINSAFKKCLWPPAKSQKCIEDYTQPDIDTWEELDVNILQKGHHTAKDAWKGVKSVIELSEAESDAGGSAPKKKKVLDPPPLTKTPVKPAPPAFVIQTAPHVTSAPKLVPCDLFQAKGITESSKNTTKEVKSPNKVSKFCRTPSKSKTLSPKRSPKVTKSSGSSSSSRFTSTDANRLKLCLETSKRNSQKLQDILTILQNFPKQTVSSPKTSMTAKMQPYDIFCKTSAAVYTFNNTLKNDPQCYNYVANKFSLVSGTDERSKCNNLLSMIMSDEAASEFSYSGRMFKNVKKGKFKELYLCDVVKEVIRNLFPTKPISEEEFKTWISEYLSQSPVRIARRTARILTIEKEAEAVLLASTSSLGTTSKPGGSQDTSENTEGR